MRKFRTNEGQKHLILVDLDGTVLKSDGKTIHQATKKALIKAQEQGHTVCIATGRPYRGSVKFYQELQLKTLICNFNGGYIHDPFQGKFKSLVFPLSETIVNQIINEPYIIDHVENAVIEYYNHAVCWKHNEFFETYFHLDSIPNDSFAIDKEAIKSWKGNATEILIQFQNNTDLDEVWRVLQKYKDSIKVHTWKKPETNILVFEISSGFINKGMAATILAQYYNIDIRDVIAYGDEINDKEMLMAVGFGVAMKNGDMAMKTIANDVTQDSNDQGGVGKHLTALLNLDL